VQSALHESLIAEWCVAVSKPDRRVAPDGAPLEHPRRKSRGAQVRRYVREHLVGLSGDRTRCLGF